jgi:hypothetical protein
MSPPLTPQARALVAAARAELEPSAGDLDRMRRRILLAAGGAAGLASASSASAAGASAGGTSAAGAAGTSAAGAAGASAAGAGAAGASAAGAGTAGAAGVAAASGLQAGVKIGLVLLVAGAAAAGGAALVSHQGTAAAPPVVRRAAPSTPPPRPAPAVRPLATAEPEIELEFAPERLERPRRTEPRDVPQAEPPPSLSQELTLVRRARAALRLGMPDRALELLAEHARRFTAPRLAQEAAVVRIEAVCATGDRARARSLTEEFGRAWPRSPLRARVGNMCGARP